MVGKLNDGLFKLIWQSMWNGIDSAYANLRLELWGNNFTEQRGAAVGGEFGGMRLTDEGLRLYLKGGGDLEFAVEEIERIRKIAESIAKEKRVGYEIEGPYLTGLTVYGGCVKFIN